MYILVLVAYMKGEAPQVRASPFMYDSRSACIKAASSAMTEAHFFLPEGLKDKVSLAYMCNAAPEEA